MSQTHVHTQQYEPRYQFSREEQSECEHEWKNHHYMWGGYCVVCDLTEYEAINAYIVHRDAPELRRLSGWV